MLVCYLWSHFVMSIQRSCHVQVLWCADAYFKGGGFGRLSLKRIWSCSQKSVLLCKRGFTALFLPSTGSVRLLGEVQRNWVPITCSSYHHGRLPHKYWNVNLYAKDESCFTTLWGTIRTIESNDSALGDGQLSAYLWCDWSEAKNEVRDCVALYVPRNNWQRLACVWEDFLVGRPFGQRERWTRSARSWRRPSFSTWSVSLQERLVGSAGYECCFLALCRLEKH